MVSSSTTTPTTGSVRRAGAVYHQAWATHMADHGLGAPHTITLDDHGLRLSLWPSDAAAWVDSLNATEETSVTRPMGGDIERVEVEGYLPSLCIRVQLRFSRRSPAAPALKVVTA